MPTFTAPGPSFPAPPAVAVDTPDGWSPLTVQDTMLAVAAPDATDGVRANVIVTVDRIPGTMTLDSAVTSLETKMRALPSYGEVGREIREVLGHDGFRIEATFQVEGRPPMFQAVHVTVINYGGGWTDKVQIVGTCNATQAATLVPVLRGILMSLRTP